MKAMVSFELSRLEMESLKSGMLNHAALLKEPLDMLCPGQADSVIKTIPEFFNREVAEESVSNGSKWKSVLSLIFKNRYKIYYQIEVKEEVLINVIDCTANVTTDMLPILKLYAQLIKTVTEFDYSGKTKNSFKALGKCLERN